MKNVIRDGDIDYHVYPDLSQIEDPLFDQLVEKEAEWWGYKPFGEYLICTDVNCRAVQSIEEVYGTDTKDKYVPLKDLEQEGPKIPPCPDCNKPSERIFNPEIYAKKLREYFRSKVFGVLLMEGGDMVGSTHAVRDTRQNILDNIINYRKGYDVPGVLGKIASQLGEPTQGVDANNEAVCLNKVAFSAKLRGRNLYPKITKAMLDVFPECDGLPIMIDTRFDTQVYPLLMAMGFKPVETDKYGSVLLLKEKYGDMREVMSLAPEAFEERFRGKIKQARGEQKEFLAQNPAFSALRKKYPGLLLENYN